jgi:acyl-CoA synthetase (AMP-forming)/AMP-acid ligase II
VAPKNTIASDRWLSIGRLLWSRCRLAGASSYDDLGLVDGDGNVVIVDRLKELIKVSGYQVAPAELEALLTAHPAVADAAVVGRRDPAHGEVRWRWWCPGPAPCPTPTSCWPGWPPGRA